MTAPLPKPLPAPDEAFAADVPYIVAIVELAVGPRIPTNIVGVDNNAVRADMPLEVVFDTVAEGVALPKFKPRI